MEHSSYHILLFTHLFDTAGSECTPAVLNACFAQCSLITFEAHERLVPVVAVVAVVEVIGEPGASGTEGGKSEKAPDEGDKGEVGERCGGRVRSYDLFRCPLRSLTGLGGSAELLEEGFRLSDIRPRRWVIRRS
jgi:hypothetical protein